MSIKIDLKIIIIFLLSLTFFAFQIRSGLTPSQQRGKLIYTKGLRSSGESISAQLSGATFDAKILPCVNCHGSRGEGNPEGGVDPSPLDWSSLTKSYLVEFKNGRKRTGYNSQSFKRAIVEGVDPSENKLDMVMPKYDMTDKDVEDLISYLKIIDKDEIEGVTDTSIHLGILLPAKDKPSGRSLEIVNTMQAYLDLVNSSGGLYNRKFELTAFFADEVSKKEGLAWKEYLSEKGIFAFIGSELEGLSQQSISAIEETKTPIIGLISGNPNKYEYLKNDFYYLFSGLDNELAQLLQFALNGLNAKGDDFVVIYNSKGDEKNLFHKKYSKYKFKILDLDLDAKDAEHKLLKLKNQGIEKCLFVGDENESLTFLKEVANMDWYPSILMSGKLAKSSWKQAPSELDGKIYFSFPSWTSVRNEKAMDQYKIMASRYNLEQQYPDAQLNGLAATILFTEVLKLTGRDVNRASFLETLHRQKNFETGFVAPLSFGPNDRVGSDEVFIVKANLIDKVLELAN